MVIHSWAESTERRVQNRRGRTPGGPPSVPYSDLDTVRTTRSGARPGRPEGKKPLYSSTREGSPPCRKAPDARKHPTFRPFPWASEWVRCAKGGIWKLGIVQSGTCPASKFRLTKQMGPYRAPGLCVSSTRTILPQSLPPSPPPHQWDSAPRPAPAPGH